MATNLSDGSGRVLGVLASIDKVKYNPASIQRVGLQHLRDVTAGLIDIVDPTNPFVFAVELTSVNTAAFMVDAEANTRKQYPSLAQTQEDLYLHMSDIDYLERFATPATTVFSIMIDKNDLLEKMILDPATGGKKITLPRNSEFTIADTTFSLQYPIDIKQLTHGGLQVVYDTSLDTPLQSLETNVIDFQIRTSRDLTELIYFEFEVQQFKINSVLGSISGSTGFNQVVSLTDSFHYARVYYKNTANKSWVEVLTTHTDQVYDGNTPTVVLKLVGNTLNVRIPQIYITNQSIQGTLRVDVYETKGPINLIMDNYTPESFSVRWRNVDKAYDTAFTAVINTLTAYTYSSKPVNAGTPALTYEQLRSRVITNSIGDRSPPITNVQIVSELDKRGYTVVKNVDVVTNRIFLATRALPKPINEKLITAGAASIETFIISSEKAVTYEGVKNNGLRITLTPEILYTNDNGIVNIFPKSNLTTLLNSGPDNIALNVTASSYLYTPFHYVLDATSDEFELRPYYLDKPVAKSIKFISQNETTGLQINTDIYRISKTSNGYILILVTKSNDATKAIDDNSIFAQLSYVPKYEESPAFLNGVLAGRTQEGERIFEFDLDTNFDIDTNHNLAINTFTLLSVDPQPSFTSLDALFTVVYSTNTAMPNNWVTGEVDKKLGTNLLPLNTVGITHEELNLIFGYSLVTLWARSRSVVSSSIYLLYDKDVPWLYKTDVYAIDPITGATMTIGPYGTVQSTLLHRKGDPILDSDGNPTYQYRIGDPVIDVNGNPVVAEKSKIIRQVDMMFIEGSYYFATDSAASTYREDIVSTVVNWLTVELPYLSKPLLEQTRLYFYPKTTMGNIKVFADDGKTTVVEAGQYFNVDLYVNDSTYTNVDLRESLRKTTIKTIDDLLKNSTFATSTAISELRSKYGNDVISLKISGLGGKANLTALSVANDGDRCNIRKRLTKLPDQKLIVEEDVTISFIRHQSM